LKSDGKKPFIGRSLKAFSSFKGHIRSKNRRTWPGHGTFGAQGKPLNNLKNKIVPSESNLAGGAKKKAAEASRRLQGTFPAISR
jgi:hypothetical protein